jgi:hypothetical protein
MGRGLGSLPTIHRKGGVMSEEDVGMGVNLPRWGAYFVIRESAIRRHCQATCDRAGVEFVSCNLDDGTANLEYRVPLQHKVSVQLIPREES